MSAEDLPEAGHAVLVSVARFRPAASPAEIDLRLFVNTRHRHRHHWWLNTSARRHQREMLQRLGWWEP